MSPETEHARLSPTMRDAIRRAERSVTGSGKWILAGPVRVGTIKALTGRQLIDHWLALTSLGEAVRAIELDKEETMAGQPKRCAGSGKAPRETTVVPVRGSGGIVRPQVRATCPDDSSHQGLPVHGGGVQGHSR
jgi:hypothetical protein